MEASLDTEKGASAIRVQGKQMQDAKVVGTSALVGALAGKMVLEEKGAEKGVLIGATIGTGAVLFSNAKNVQLPKGAELTIQLDEPLIIPK